MKTIEKITIVICLIISVVTFKHVFIDREEIQRDDSKDAIARIVELSNHVRFRESNSVGWQDAGSFLPLFNDDYVFTSADSSALITYVDGVELKLGKETLVRITKDKDYVGLSIDFGEVVVRNTKKNAKSKIRVKYEGKEVIFQGTEQEVRFSKEESVEFELTSGFSSVSIDKQDFNISKNETYKVKDIDQRVQLEKLPNIEEIETARIAEEKRLKEEQELIEKEKLRKERISKLINTKPNLTVAKNDIVLATNRSSISFKIANKEFSFLSRTFSKCDLVVEGKGKELSWRIRERSVKVSAKQLKEVEFQKAKVSYFCHLLEGGTYSSSVTMAKVFFKKLPLTKDKDLNYIKYAKKTNQIELSFPIEKGAIRYEYQLSRYKTFYRVFRRGKIKRPKVWIKDDIIGNFYLRYRYSDYWGRVSKWSKGKKYIAPISIFHDPKKEN